LRYPTKGLRFGGLGTPRFNAKGNTVPKVKFYKEKIMSTRAAIIDAVSNKVFIKARTGNEDGREGEAVANPKYLQALLKIFSNFLPVEVSELDISLDNSDILHFIYLTDTTYRHSQTPTGIEDFVRDEIATSAAITMCKTFIGIGR
jgi:hypothetical protein